MSAQENKIEVTGGDYNKTICCSNTFVDNNNIDCTNANISADSSATLKLKGTVTCGQKATIKVRDSAFCYIQNLNCNEVEVDVDNSSTLCICGGTIGTLSGNVRHSSTMHCSASVAHNVVNVTTASTYDSTCNVWTCGL